VVRLEQVLDLGQLAHQLVVDVQAPGGVEDQHVDAGVAGSLHRALAHLHGNAHRLAVRRDLVGFGVEGDARPAGQVVLRLVRDGLELVHGRGALEVRRGKHDRSAPLLEVPREFAAGGGLP
jgi:hypothetical protein